MHDADSRAHVVNIRVTFSHTLLTMPKSGEERPVPMAEPLRAILAEAVVGKQAEDRLVTEVGGKTPTRQRLYRAFIALQKRLKIAPTWRELYTPAPPPAPALPTWAVVLLTAGLLVVMGWSLPRGPRVTVVEPTDARK